MALLRDPKIVKIVAESLNIEQINDEACRIILSDLELKLRLIINDSIKYMKQFNRDKIRIEDVNFALKDNNFFENFFGFEINESYEYSRLGDVWVMQNAEVDIKQQIYRELQKLKRFPKPKLSFKWLSIDGVVPKTNENSFIITKNEETILKDPQPEPNLLEPEKMTDKLPKEILLLQSSNVLLSQEMQHFLDLLLKSVKEEEERIDQEMTKGKYQQSEKFKKVLANLRLSSALNNVLPFVLNFISSDYKKALFNGFEKRLLYVKVLIELINNTSINYEFHLHLFIKILMHFLTSDKISVNVTSTQYELRETASKALFCLIKLYEDKYKHLKFQICEILLAIFNENMFNYEANFGILCFFFYMDSIIIYEMLIPSIVKLLESDQFHQDLTTYITKPKQEAMEYNENLNNSMINKWPKPKKGLHEKTNLKLNEAYKTYLMIMKCCCQLMVYFPYIQRSSNKEYAIMYEYFQEIMGETMIPIATKTFTWNRDVSSKIINLHKSEGQGNLNFAETLNPLEFFI